MGWWMMMVRRKPSFVWSGRVHFDHSFARWLSCTRTCSRNNLANRLVRTPSCHKAWMWGKRFSCNSVQRCPELKQTWLDRLRVDAQSWMKVPSLLLDICTHKWKYRSPRIQQCRSWLLGKDWSLEIQNWKWLVQIISSFREVSYWSHNWRRCIQGYSFEREARFNWKKYQVYLSPVQVILTCSNRNQSNQCTCHSDHMGCWHIRLFLKQVNLESVSGTRMNQS